MLFLPFLNVTVSDYFVNQEDIKCFENNSVGKNESEYKLGDSMHSLYTISHGCVLVTSLV